MLALEKDPALVRELATRFSDEIAQGRLILRECDVRDFEPGSIAEPYVLAANVPYYITSAILRYFLERPHKPLRMVVMVQQEVAQRLVAEPGDMSLLSVSVQYYGTAKVVTRLSPAAFWPRPDVTSALVRIDVYEDAERPVTVADESAFFRVVRAGFSQKRKKLRNSLSGGLGIDKQEIDTLLIAAGIDPERRAETLTLPEWGALTGAVLQAEG